MWSTAFRNENEQEALRKYNIFSNKIKNKIIYSIITIFIIMIIIFYISFHYYSSELKIQKLTIQY